MVKLTIKETTKVRFMKDYLSTLQNRDNTVVSSIQTPSGKYIIKVYLKDFDVTEEFTFSKEYEPEEIRFVNNNRIITSIFNVKRD